MEEENEIDRGSDIYGSEDINEEDYNSEEELMPTLLPIEGDQSTMDLEKAPQNANEYLLQVRAQAAQLERNTVATHLENTTQHAIQNNYTPNSYLLSYFQKNKQIQKQPLTELTSEYRALIIKNFQKLKDTFEAARKSKLDLHQICDFSQQPPSTLQPRFLERKANFRSIFLSSNPEKQINPSVDIVYTIDLVLADKMIDWICDEIYELQENNKTFSAYQCLWLFSILTVFEKPLLSDTCGMLNEIFTFLIKSLEILEPNQTAICRGHEAIAVVIMDYFEQRLESSSPFEPVVDCPTNVELEGKIGHVVLTKISYIKTFFYALGSLLTAGVFALLGLWLPNMRIACTLKKTTIEDATQIIIHGADGSVEVKALLREGPDQYLTFEYRLFKYIYVTAACKFIPAQFTISGTTYSKIHECYGPGIDDDTAAYRHIYYGSNLTDIPKKSYLRLFIEEVLSPFYVFQIFSIVVWSLDSYGPYAGLIGALTLVSIIQTLYETRKNVEKLRELAYFECDVTVFRNGAMDNPLIISSAKLVPGDVFVVPDNRIMPCDAILLNGSCIMNESMLTGESIPVLKNSLPYSEITYSLQEDKQYTLCAGTQCIQTRYFKGNSVLALVTDIGFTTVKGELIRTMLFPKASNFKFYVDSFKFLGLLGAMAIVGFLIDLPQLIEGVRNGKAEVTDIIIKGAEIVTITVPPALPACMAVGVSYGLSKLKERGMFCISPNKINEAGKIKIMCFDKTGTLTEEGLDILGVRTAFFDKNFRKLGFRKLEKNIMNLRVYPFNREEDLPDYINYDKVDNKKSIYEVSEMLPEEHMFEIMATCHSLTVVDGQLIGDPLDVKMFEATSRIIEENPTDKFDNLVQAIIKPNTLRESIGSIKEIDQGLDFQVDTKDIGIIRRFDFSSKLQRMSVVVKHIDEPGFRLHVKGSPEKIRELCKPETIPPNFHNILEKYAENGYRVLALSTRALNTNYKKVSTGTRDDFEHSLTFIGFLIMENRLKPITTSIIDTLQEAHIKTIMVTGDNVLTAISVARQCHIVHPHQRVFLGDLSEKKINNENYIVWKDFEHAEVRLDADNLEPENQDEVLMEVEVYDELKASVERPAGTKGTQSLHDSIQRAKTDVYNKVNFGSQVARNVTSSHLQKRAEEEEGSVNNSFAHVNLDFLDMDPPFLGLESQEYTLAVTGKAFAMILEEAEKNSNKRYKKILRKMLMQCSVYARMLPDQKALMITHHQSIEDTIVGMCGDGANDCGALKAANAGVSLSEAEASIAAPFTSKIQDISCIVNLLRYGRAALVTSFQTFKYIALYSVIQFTSVTILYYNTTELTNASYYYIDIFLILPLSALMSIQEAHEKLSKYQPSDRLVSWPILTSFVGQSAIQISVQLVIAYMILSDKYALNPCGGDLNENGDACDLNTALFLCSNFQYTVVALAFNAGKPFRKSFYTNRWFTMVFFLMMGLNIYLATNPHEYVRNVMDISEMRPEFLKWLLIIAVINIFATFLWERLFVQGITMMVHRVKKMRKISELKKVAEQNPHLAHEWSHSHVSDKYY